MGFFSQEYWSGLPFPSPGDLPHPGITPRSPTLQADALLSETPGKPEKTIIQKGTCTPVFTVALFTTARTWKQPRCPSIGKYIMKLWYIYTTEYYSAIEKNEIMLSAVIWMDLEIIILSEVSQTERQVSYDTIYMCNF